MLLFLLTGLLDSAGGVGLVHELNALPDSTPYLELYRLVLLLKLLLQVAPPVVPSAAAAASGGAQEALFTGGQ